MRRFCANCAWVFSSLCRHILRTDLSLSLFVWVGLLPESQCVGVCWLCVVFLAWLSLRKVVGSFNAGQSHDDRLPASHVSDVINVAKTGP